MPSPDFKAPANLADWAELEITPPKNEREEARLVEGINSGKYQLVVVIPFDGSPTKTVLAQIIDIPSPKIRSNAAADPRLISGLGRAIILRALQDMRSPDMQLSQEDVDSVRSVLIEMSEKVRAELGSDDRHTRLSAAKLIALCCASIELPGGTTVNLFSQAGANVFAEMFADAEKVLENSITVTLE